MAEYLNIKGLDICDWLNHFLRYIQNISEEKISIWIWRGQINATGSIISYKRNKKFKCGKNWGKCEYKRVGYMRLALSSLARTLPTILRLRLPLPYAAPAIISISRFFQKFAKFSWFSIQRFWYISCLNSEGLLQSVFQINTRFFVCM